AGLTRTGGGLAADEVPQVTMRFSDPNWLLAGLLTCTVLIAMWRRYDVRQQTALAEFIAPHLRQRLTGSVSKVGRFVQRGLLTAIGRDRCSYDTAGRYQHPECHSGGTCGASQPSWKRQNPDIGDGWRESRRGRLNCGARGGETGRPQDLHGRHRYRGRRSHP